MIIDVVCRISCCRTIRQCFAEARLVVNFRSYYLYCSYRQRPLANRTVENGVFHYPVGPFALSLELHLQPLLQLASSDVNLTCGVKLLTSFRSVASILRGPLG